MVDGTGEKPYEIITAENTASGAPSACSDTYYLVDNFKEYDTFHWRYNDANVSSRWKGPRYDLTDIRRGNTNLTRGNNNCGFSEGTFWSKGAYDGTTTKKANISGSSCGSDDGHNVVSWGDTGGPLAQACQWRSGGDLKHGDIKINNGSGVTWFSNKPADCSNAYDLEGLMTHEWGHIFGLEDLSESSHGNLTMSIGMPKCSTSVRTLGNGDWQGMDSLYG